MESFSRDIAILLTLAAIFGFLNYRFLKLPRTIGLVIIALLASLGRFSEKYAVLCAHLNGDSLSVRTTKIGPPLLFDRLWRQIGLDRLLAL